jgi:zinc resistance-associated protein
LEECIMKKRLVTLLAVASLIALSAVAFAAPRGGRAAAAKDVLTPEKQAAVQQIFEAHQDKLYELREQIWAKHAELQALTASGKAERGDIQSLIGDITKLRTAMHQERQAIRKEIETKTGIKGFGPGGFHRGFGGYGYGGCGGDGGCGFQGKGSGRGMGPGQGMGPGMGFGPGMGAY